jgi:dUTP pyrophosphatase
MFGRNMRKAFIVQDEIAKGLPLPNYGRPGDVCVDVPVAEDATIPPFSGIDVRTGLRIKPPDGFYFRVVGKGSSAKRGLTFTLEVVDPGYRGELILHPWNCSSVPVQVTRGKCIAQLELVGMNRFEWKQVDELDATARGEGRMDSTKTGI